MIFRFISSRLILVLDLALVECGICMVYVSCKEVLELYLTYTNLIFKEETERKGKDGGDHILILILVISSISQISSLSILRTRTIPGDSHPILKTTMKSLVGPLVFDHRIMAGEVE